MAIAYYEFKDAKSNKFWEIEVKGKTVTVRFGKIGTDGQVTVKSFPNASEADAHASKVTAEKTKKGYTKAKRAVASKAKATGAKKKGGKQPSTKRSSNKTKSKKPATRKPSPTSQSELVAWLKEPGRSGPELVSAAGRFAQTDRLIAAYGEAPPKLLAKLSHSKDRSTRAKVAANPNTPAEDYVRLGQQFPKEFLANPLLDLLLLEDPAWAQQLPEGLLVQVLKREGCPADFLVWASSQSSEKVQLAVAMNAKAPEVALSQLRRSKHSKVREAVPEGLDADPEAQFREAVRARLAALTPKDAYQAWEKKDIGLAQFTVLSFMAQVAVASITSNGGYLSSHFLWLEYPTEAQIAERRRLETLLEKPLKKPREMPWYLKKLSKASVEVRQAVERNDYLCYCGKDPNRAVLSRRPLAVLLALASGPFVTPDRIARVSGSSDWLIRAAVARNRGTPPRLREKLKRDAHLLVRALASAADVPATIPKTSKASAGFDAKRVTSELSKLLRGRPGRDLRIALAESSKCPLPWLDYFAADSDAAIRASVVTSKISVEMLSALARDKSAEVRKRIATCERTPAADLALLVNDRSWDVRYNAIRNPKLPAAARLAAIEHKDSFVADAAAKGRRERLSLLERWANDDDWRNRMRAAEDSKATEAMLEKLAGDKESLVRSNVAKNARATEAILEKLAGDKEWSVRSGVAENPRATEAMLERLAGDKDGVVGPPRMVNGVDLSRGAHVVRSTVARNPHVTEAILEKLAGDDDNHVRYWVAKNRRATAAILEKLAGDEDEDVRIEVARHPTTPRAVLTRLTGDSAQQVRKIVTRRLKKS